ncbi:MAG: hydrogenase maturation nickel metallochaperone HypA [Bacteroidia bacterium]|nr:hydrogenase maturation nickel metallochaperone HypA [Bacteroidia bacterium]
MARTMHELSLVQSIFASLREELSKEELAKLTRVDMKIGVLANVEPTLLQNAFLAYQESNPEYKQVALSTERVQIKIHCSSCKKKSAVTNYIFRCQHCGQPSNDIKEGEELLIHQIHF